MSQSRQISRHYSPLRYPGGKGKLCSYVKRVLELNGLVDCRYVEPYAGGAAIALELLAHEYVLSAHINDISRPLVAFWRSVLEHPDEFCRLLVDTKINIRTWDKQKKIFLNSSEYDDLELGFATFFLNRTNRSGILNGGIIGGREQESEWGIKARYNKDGLLSRIRMIVDLKDRITITNCDAIEFIQTYSNDWRTDTFVYFDPPYYNKSRHLYYDYYEGDDHKKVAREIGKMRKQRWIVSYDNHSEIRHLFRRFRFATYDIGYSARDHKDGNEVMFFSPSLLIPEPSSNMKGFELGKAA